jgi:CysZ protein
MSYTQSPSHSTSGFHYFAEGWRLISRPGIKRYVVLPLLVNVLLMGSPA